MEIHYLGTTLKSVQFTVHGDGRVLGRIVSTGADQRVFDEFEHRLDESQVREWVEQAVHSGLVDFDSGTFVREIRERGGEPPYVVDGGAVFFKIRLDYLARGGDAPEAPFSHSFILDFPDEYARRYPESAEFRTLQQISSTLDEIYWAHRKQR